MRRSIAPWAALAGSLALTAAVAAFVFVNGRTRERARFVQAMRTAVERIQGRIEVYQAMLRGCAALLAAEPGLHPREFHRYAERIDLEDRYPGVQGVGFARRLKQDEIAPVEADLRRRGFEGLRIWPDSPAEERTAVLFLEPLDRRNRAAIGYDMSTDPVRRLAMERARDEGTAAMSARVTLVQEIDSRPQPGFLLYVPVYAQGHIPATVEARRAALIGWMYAPFRTGDLFVSLFGEEQEPLLDFQVYDGGEANPALRLYDRGMAPTSGARLAQTERLRIGGREWTLTFAALPPLRTGSGSAVLAALLIGAAISGVISALSLRESRARLRAESAKNGLQRALEEQRHYEDRLREEARVNSILPRLGISLAAELDPDRLAQLVVGEATALTGADYGAIFTAGAEPRALASSGPARESFPAAAAEQLGRMGSTKEAARVDASEDPALAGAPARSLLAVPITSRTGQILGCLAFAHGSAGHFTVQHQQLAEGIAAQASIALDNARLLRDLQEADRRKDEFLAILGHELRNPLAPVVTALEVIKRDRSAIDRQLSIIERQARHMVRIVDDLLDVSRISRGKIELRKQRLSVREALARAADSLSPMARTRELKLTVSFPPRPVSVEADPVRLEQILGNLLSNAIKYTPRGGEVELLARAHDRELEVQVRDTGIGIAPSALGTLFDPFVQARGAKDFAKGGLGIGLALVRALVELHGGSVRAESAGPGRGSTFTVRLPGAIEGATPVEIVPAPPRAHPGRVLVVDDNLDAADTLAEAVRLDGHEVRIAHDGPSALQVARDFAPEVVLLDIGLPGMDGYEVVRKLREIHQIKGAQIVALTGFGQQSDRQRALSAGFDDHLVKPVDLETVTAVLRRRLGAA